MSSNGHCLGLSLTYIIENSTAELMGLTNITEKVEIGVPQGSCFGPLLCLIYITMTFQILSSSQLCPCMLVILAFVLESNDISQLNGDINVGNIFML